MIAIILPSLYFVLLFGSFEVFVSPKGGERGGAYWTDTATTSVYFLSATAIALVLFSTAPLELILETSIYGVLVLILLYVGLSVLAMHGWFTFLSESNTIAEARGESFRYVFAKSTDILFQDVLAVIVILAFKALLEDTVTTLVVFSVFFFVAHALLLVIIPTRLALFFLVPSVFAGVAFAAIVLYDIEIVYIFILHWLFYAATYSVIKNLRTKGLSVPQTM